MSALRAALRSFDVHLRLSGHQVERRLPRVSRNPKTGSREHLAISAIANMDAVRIDLGLVRDLAAMAGTLDFHRHPPKRYSDLGIVNFASRASTALIVHNYQLELAFIFPSLYLFSARRMLCGMRWPYS
jgi:hypothetical protein